MATLVYNRLRRRPYDVTSGVNFINILRTAFPLVDPKSVKKIDNLTVFFTLLGSARLKAVRRTLMKLSPTLSLYSFVVFKVTDHNIIVYLLN